MTKLKTVSDNIAFTEMLMTIIDTYASKYYAYSFAKINYMRWPEPELMTNTKDAPGVSRVLRYDTYVNGLIGGLQKQIDWLNNNIPDDSDPDFELSSRIIDVITRANICIDRHEQCMDLIRRNWEKNPVGGSDDGGSDKELTD